MFSEFLWDPETEVWIATSNDVLGLVLESGSFDALVERVRIAIPELLELITANAIMKQAGIEYRFR